MILDYHAIRPLVVRPGMPLCFKAISAEFVINFELSSFSGKNVLILKKFNPILF